MRLVDQHLRLSATDLANHLSCAHLTQLSRAVAEGRDRKPKSHDPIAEILRERGMAHEAAYLAHLRETEGIDVVTIGDDSDADGLETTRAAMQAGAPLIYQAPLAAAHWHGRADFLRRIETPSALGAWSYEVIARSSRPKRGPEPSCSFASTRSWSQSLSLRRLRAEHAPRCSSICTRSPGTR